MNNHWTGGALFADLVDWRRMGDAFKGSGAELSQADLLSLVALALVAVVLIWVLQRLANRQDTVRAYNRPKRLFGQLCRAHHLSRTERKLLLRLADHCRLDQPATLFLKPDLFAIEGLPPQLQEERAELHVLRRRLFAVEG